MVLPPTLEKGDRIGVVAPSSPIDLERLDRGAEYLERRGYEVVRGRAVRSRDRYLAGSDEERTGDLQEMFDDSTIRALFAARGGYGSARLLDAVDWEAARRSPKSLVGFSDTTALQLGLYAQTKIVSFSGFMVGVDVTETGVEPLTENSLWDALEHHRWCEPSGLEAVREGDVSGPVLGGCLSLVASLAGSAHLPSLRGCIVVLEDVNEAPYRIDRMLTQLRSAGAFVDSSAVLFGRFQGCDERADDEDGTVRSVIESFTADVSCPVYTGLPYGHGDGRVVLPIGRDARLENGTLRFTEV